jgi:hypothetical protein
MDQHTAHSRTRLTVLTAVALAGLAAGCGSDGLTVTVGDAPGRDRIEPVVDATVALPDGWFEMSGYGTVLHVDGDGIVLHHVTASTCTVGAGFDNELPVDYASEDEAGVVTLDLVGPTTDYRLLPLTRPLDCAGGAEHSLTALDEVFGVHYPFFAERGVEWSDSIDTIRAAVAADRGTFRGALADFMVELADGHTTLDDLSIDPELERFGMDEVATLADAATAMQDELDATLARVDGLQTGPAGTVAWGLLDDSVGYLLLTGFEGVGGDDDPVADREAFVDALDVAIADLDTRVERVVVDVRFNQGGYEDLAVLAAGYFVDDTTPAYRKWAHADPDPVTQVVDVEPQSVGFDGDVVVLTSPVTASAAEVFAVAMAEVADATIVGNRSFGEFSDAIDWVLPNGIEFTLSMEVYTDLDGTSYEVAGVPVDIEAPFDRGLAVAAAHLD